MKKDLEITKWTLTDDPETCDHNLNDVYYEKRATWICKSCGGDISLLYVLVQQAIS